MTTIVARIDNVTITADDLVKFLALNSKLEEILEGVIEDSLTVYVAKKSGIKVSSQEIQERSDQYRRINGLHRTKDTLAHLESMNVTVDDFETFLSDSIYHERMMEQIASEKAVKEHFRLHSPKFDAIECHHILLSSEGIANELVAVLSEDSSLFEEMAKEHSICPDTTDKGGSMGKVMRGTLTESIEAKLFNAAVGDVVGAFQSGDGLMYEIFLVKEKFPAELDSPTIKAVAKLLHEEWLESKASEHRVEIM